MIDSILHALLAGQRTAQPSVATPQASLLTPSDARNTDSVTLSAQAQQVVDDNAQKNAPPPPPPSGGVRTPNVSNDTDATDELVETARLKVRPLVGEANVDKVVSSDGTIDYAKLNDIVRKLTDEEQFGAPTTGAAALLDELV